MSEAPAEYLREIFVVVSALARASRTGTGGNLKTSRCYHEPGRMQFKKKATFSFRQGQVQAGPENGGRYRIRTYDFHRVKMALYR